MYRGPNSVKFENLIPVAKIVFKSYEHYKILIDLSKFISFSARKDTENRKK